MTSIHAVFGDENLGQGIWIVCKPVCVLVFSVLYWMYPMIVAFTLSPRLARSVLHVSSLLVTPVGQSIFPEWCSTRFVHVHVGRFHHCRRLCWLVFGSIILLLQLLCQSYVSRTYANTRLRVNNVVITYNIVSSDAITVSDQ